MYQTLTTYQTSTIGQVLAGRRVVELPYGSGKSVVALHSVIEMMQANGTKMQGLCMIIFCKPRHSLTWRRNISQWWPSAVEVVENEDGMQTLLGPSQYTTRTVVLLVSHARIARNVKTLLKVVNRFPRTALIFDESTAIKNPKARITKAAHEIAKASDTHALRLCLTGNATPEHETELWGQFEFVYVRNNPLKTYYRMCRDWFISHDYGLALALDRRDEWQDLRKAYVVTLDEDEYREFREKTGNVRRNYVVETYEETAEQRRLVDHLMEYWSLAIDGHVEDYEYVMQLDAKRQQIAGSFIYLDMPLDDPIMNHITHRITHRLKQNPKALLLGAVIKDLIEENCERRIIVWRQFRADEEAIREVLERNCIEYVVGPDERALRLFDLDAEDADGPQHLPSVIIMPASTSEGFNELVKADTAIFYSNNMSGEKRTQAEARIDRIGQTAPAVTIIDLASPRAIDMNIVALLQSKDLTEERLGTLYKRYRRHFDGDGK